MRRLYNILFIMNDIFVAKASTGRQRAHGCDDVISM